MDDLKSFCADTKALLAIAWRRKTEFSFYEQHSSLMNKSKVVECAEKRDKGIKVSSTENT